MTLSDIEDAFKSNWSTLSTNPIVQYCAGLFVLVVRNWLLFGIYLIFILIVAESFGRNLGLPHLFRNDPAVLSEYGAIAYILSGLSSSPGIWGHVAITLLLLTILIAATVKEILNDDRQILDRENILGNLFKFGWFFIAVQVGSVVFRDVREGASVGLLIQEVGEAIAGIAIGILMAILIMKFMELAYHFNRRWLAPTSLGQWSSWLFKKVTIKALWRNGSSHPAWVSVYFLFSVLVAAGIFISSGIIVPGVALGILVILMAAGYFALGLILPRFRNPLILVILFTYGTCSYDPFKVELPDFTIAGNNGKNVNLYDCPLLIENWRDNQNDRNFDCAALNNPFTMAALDRAVPDQPVIKRKRLEAASKVVKGDGTLDLDTCVMLEAWRARQAGRSIAHDQLREACKNGHSRLARSISPPGRSPQAQKPKLVVVTASGGAYRAGFWTALVLDELIDRSERGRNLENLADNIKLLTGASGGMVASAYFAALSAEAGAATWSSPNPPSITNRLLADIKNSRDAKLDQEKAPGKFKTRFPIGRDSLGPVAQQTLQRDIIRSVLWPLPIKSSLSWKDWDDRGLVLEQQWATLDKTFGDLRAGWLVGKVPSLILSPMIVDTGQPLMISNANIFSTLDRSEDAAVSLFKIFPEMRDQMKVQTAVRLNASFPYISPAVSLPTKPKMRIVDAGYYDNYGVNTAVAWLSQPGMVEYLDEQTSGVIIIQIRAYATEPSSIDGPDKPDVPYLPEWVTSPVTGVSQARNSSMLFRNTKELNLFSSLFCEGFVQTVAFENTLGGDDISMSWYLRQDELNRMKKGLNENTTLACGIPRDDDNLTAEEKADCALITFNQEVFDNLERVWQSDQTSHPSCKGRSADRLASRTLR